MDDTIVLDYLSYDYVTATDYSFKHRKSGFVLIQRDERKRCYMLSITDTNKKNVLELRVIPSSSFFLLPALINEVILNKINKALP